jgi:DNA-binding transcriptional MerR regulator/methylmalonyl-CoA mutase cobalamin-binding subunit
VNTAQDSTTASGLLSIGEVAEATGISSDTIRVWERRYGRPEPIRLPSGHRRYSIEQVHWLRRVAAALALGNRASRAVRAGEAELDEMLAELVDEERAEVLAALVDAVRAYREPPITERLWRDWSELGPERTLTRTVAPLMDAVGEAWAAGELDVRHEHFLSEVTEHFLRSARLSLEHARHGPVVILATLESEHHALGLHMAAITVVLAGGRPIVLGRGTPVREIAQAAREAKASVVALSVSLATGGVETDRVLAELRRQLPPEIRLAVGGRGARGVRRGPRGVEYPEGLEGFGRWLQALV